MCGRFSLTLSPDLLVRYFGLELAHLFSFAPSYNVAPTETVPVLRLEDGERKLALLRWGLIPHWARNASIGNRMINARSETVAAKPAFRSAFRQRRGIVAIDGFFEWTRTGKGQKHPYFIHNAVHQPLALATLWDHWEGETGDGRKVIESFTILTTASNALVGRLHERMPVILQPKNFSLWLDPASRNDDLEKLLVPCPDEMLALYPVSLAVNRPRNKGAECVTPVQGELF